MQDTVTFSRNVFDKPFEIKISDVPVASVLGKRSASFGSFTFCCCQIMNRYGTHKRTNEQTDGRTDGQINNGQNRNATCMDGRIIKYDTTVVTAMT